MTRFLLVCAGGAFGTGLRYLLSTWSVRAFGPRFPYGTILVNVIGSFLLALILQRSSETSLLGAEARLIIGTGILGGFTTYSTFNYDTLALMRDGAWTLALTNVAVTLCGCLLAGMLGIAAGKAMAG